MPNSRPKNTVVSRRDVLRLAIATAACVPTFPLFGQENANLEKNSVEKGAFAPGAIIRTLLKDISPNELNGPVLFHEHLSMKYPPQRKEHFTDDVDMMIEEVRAAGKDGIACIVDGGHPDMQRNLDALLRIAKESGMPIVASGGYYMQRTYPPEISTQTVDQIAAHLINEATQQRLGALGEIGQQDGVMTNDETKVFQAVAKAQVQTGLPIFTHNAYTGTRAVETMIPMGAALLQLDILEAAGAKPDRIAIGHVCCLDDSEVKIAKRIAERGAYVGFDRVTIESIISDDKRAAMLMKLVEAGFADKLLIASDFAVGRALKSRGGPGIAQAWTVFVPKLRKLGLTEDIVRNIMIDNPRRFLAFVPH